MILPALANYYNRIAENESCDIAPLGWENKEIPFLFVLDETGKLLDIEDTREMGVDKKQAKSFLVPQGEKKTCGIIANLLWDSVGYVIGILNTSGMTSNAATKKNSRLPKEHQAFIERIEMTLFETPRKKALLAFLYSVEKEMLCCFPNWEELGLANSNVSFRFVSDSHLFCQSEEVKQAMMQNSASPSDKAKQFCLVTGEKDTVSNVHTAIKGVFGAQSVGANIVSFNLPSFTSYGKQQGDNAPIGKKAMFAYTTALNSLLGKNSKQRMQIGDVSIVFWAAKKNQFEDDFLRFFSEPPKDNPNANVQCIRNLLDPVKTDACKASSDDDIFYILGLSPNVARISIRFWFSTAVSELSDRIHEYFVDMEMDKPSYCPEFYSIWRLLVNVAIQGKSENIPSNIVSDFIRSIMTGEAYPQSLLQMTLRRIRSDAEYRVTPARASLLKIIINRRIRIYPEQGEKELSMALDINQPSIGYQLGRLFALLSKINEEANSGINSSFVGRYYEIACSTPISLFGTQIRLMWHQLAKIDSKERRVQLEWQVSEIIDHLDGFPAHLNLDEQGKFAIGYYHQWQTFFKKKEAEVSNQKEVEDEFKRTV
ncbi:type I-C CRISPR-associated protein Cas8c/Csd1 [uncultured Sphaerochaeta sp.]|uniref:type I-C CRISPR-associated protein Cas8c/Csd1 n=1 Tax=uncultured Sphaerochaeta sp. TaxID=886478 RepID=UPI002A0A15D2|nr:type I-C CRISPR-associated protein Cas8c/Csd1 [uncultured Sphaerochaeta sp.]